MRPLRKDEKYCLVCKMEDCDEEDARCLYRVAEKLQTALKQREKLSQTISNMRDKLIGIDRSAYYKSYYQTNRTEKLAKVREYAKNNREKINERRRQAKQRRQQCA